MIIVTTGYGTDGRISSAGFLHGGEEKQLTYAYLPGTNLLQTLTKPNGMTLTQSYEPQRDLLTGMAYHRGSTLVAQRTYTYDSLGRPLNRSTARSGQTVNDSFGYNNRSELTTATVNGGSYAYDYDNIGNRKTAQEAAEEITGYSANNLNQYTALTVDGDVDFAPEFDADGNQTRVKTSTGIWAISYDAENRPKDFTSQAADGTITSVHCEYDYMGRRTTKMVTVGNNVTLQQRYIYRGYLQIACIDLTRTAHPALWFITWDSTQPVATRPLAIQKDGSWFTYGWDLTKNICELYGPAGYIRTDYNYTPYGQVSSTGDVEQPIKWSSEFNDTELGLIYYNYRHYNPVDGRWLGRDKKDSATGNHIYAYVSNFPVLHGDQLGEDRYYYCYSGDIGLHGVLIIDNWKKKGCKYEKRTPVEYGLQPEDVKYFDNLIDVFLTYVNTFHILHIEYYYTMPFPRTMYINAYIKRRLYRAPIPKSAEIIKSTPEEDMEAHNILTEEMKSNQPYNLIFSNCHHWAIDNKYIGMKENQ